MNNSKAVIISGATSMIGIACIQECLAQGMTVVALVRRGTNRIDRLPKHLNLEIIECDSDEYERVQLTPRNYVLFFHFAWRGTSRAERNDPELQIENVTQAIQAVRLAARMGCCRFVGAGSQAEYGLAHEPLRPDSRRDPVIAYGVAKDAAHQMCRIECLRANIEFCWARIFSVYGPYDSGGTLINTLIDHLERGEKPALSSCEQVWDYLYSADCGKAMLLIGQRGKNGAVYCVGSGQGHPLRYYVEIIARIYGVDIRSSIGRLTTRTQQTQFLQADIQTLHEDTGFVPQTDFECGIRKVIEWKRGKKNENDFRADSDL